MALLMMESFDTRVLRKGWSQGVGGFTAPGRFGGAAASANGPMYAYGGAAITTAVMGFAYRPAVGTMAVLGTAARLIVQISGADGVTHLTAMFTTTGQVELRRGTTAGTVIATGTPNFVDNTWMYVEAKATIHDTTGSFTLKIDGTTAVSFSGDTKNAGTAPELSQFVYGGNNSSTLIDDAYLLDTSGPAPYNDFLGDCKIETLVPNGAGASTQLTPSTGNNWAAVDELPASATDYVGSATVGLKDTYAFTDLTTTSGTVFAVQVGVAALKPDAGVAAITPLSRTSGGTEQDYTTEYINASLTWYHTGPRITDPSGSPWTIASVNSSQFGVKTA